MDLDLSEPANQDLSDIESYLIENAPDRSVIAVRHLLEAANGLLEWPHRGRARPELGFGIRSVVAGSYVIFYEIRLETIYILRFFHSSRDPAGLQSLE